MRLAPVADISLRSGGMFGNGAITAAFVYAFGNASRSTKISGSMGDGEGGNGFPDSRMLTHSDYDWIPENGYATTDEAAQAGLGLAKSNGQDSLEFGGGIVKVGDRYWFTDPVTTGQGAHFGANVILPKGGSFAGLYHTHPRGDASIFFSPDDVGFSESNGVRSYIGSHQDRAIRFYDPQTMNPATVRYQGMRIPGASRGDYLCKQCF